MSEEVNHCICSAKYSGECACGYDWTDPEVKALRAENTRLREALVQIGKLTYKSDYESTGQEYAIATNALKGEV
jgi:hypothetical protein